MRQKEKMKTKKAELLKIIEVCRGALESCGDNYGSEGCDNGDYEKHFDEDEVDKALKMIRKIK